MGVTARGHCFSMNNEQHSLLTGGCFGAVAVLTYLACEAGATTNSASGVTDLEKVFPTMEASACTSRGRLYVRARSSFALK